ncbi:16616_t:CDS:2 [Entrophospora sp. SA101]|nr:16616_t:CDS:2 [Entrophospora sp. SA101]CAJ0826966.1 14311_t:CDS:2 [Entrophospora sp. SA101]
MFSINDYYSRKKTSLTNEQWHEELALEIFNKNPTHDQRLLELVRKWEIEAFEKATSKESYEHFNTQLLQQQKSVQIQSQPVLPTVEQQVAQVFKNQQILQKAYQTRPDSLTPQQMVYYQQLLRLQQNPLLQQILIQRPPTTVVHSQLGHLSTQQNVSPQLLHQSPNSKQTSNQQQQQLNKPVASKINLSPEEYIKLDVSNKQREDAQKVDDDTITSNGGDVDNGGGLGINEMIKRMTKTNQQAYLVKEQTPKTFDNNDLSSNSKQIENIKSANMVHPQSLVHPNNININTTQPALLFSPKATNNSITQQQSNQIAKGQLIQPQSQPQQLIQRQVPNPVHSPNNINNNNNQNTMNSTNTPANNNTFAHNLINQQNNNNPASYIRTILNPQLNPDSNINPAPNLPMRIQRQVNQRTNIKSEEAVVAIEEIRRLDAKACEKKIPYRELPDLSDDEKAKIHEKLELLKPMYNEIDKILPYFYHYTKSQVGTHRLIIMKHMIRDQLKELPGRYFLSLKSVEDLLVHVNKYFVFVENRRKGIKEELNFTATNNSTPTNVPSQTMPSITQKAISLTLPTPKHSSDANNKKHKLDNEQKEGKSFDSYENLNKKRMLESHVTDRNEVKYNDSENTNTNNNNNIDSGHDNAPEDYDKEASFEDIHESLKDMMNTLKGIMDTEKAAEESEDSLLPCSTCVEISPDLHISNGKKLSNGNYFQRINGDNDLTSDELSIEDIFKQFNIPLSNVIYNEQDDNVSPATATKSSSISNDNSSITSKACLLADAGYDVWFGNS